MARISHPLPAGATNEAQISAFEEYIGHRLPVDYRQFLFQLNGGRPVPDAVLLNGEEEDIVMCFFPMRDLQIGNVDVEAIEELRTWPLHCAWDDLQSERKDLYAEAEIEQALLPIGTDGSGNYFCVVLDGDHADAVVFLDLETGDTFSLANSFTAFLSSLRERTRMDYAIGSE